MLLAKAGDHLLVRLGVLLKADRRVLLDQPLHPLRDLALVALVLDLDGHRQARLRELDALERNDLLWVAQRVACNSARQLCDSADIAGRDKRGVLLLFACHVDQLPKALLLAGARVDGRHLARQLAGNDLEVA